MLSPELQVARQHRSSQRHRPRWLRLQPRVPMPASLRATEAAPADHVEIVTIVRGGQLARVRKTAGRIFRRFARHGHGPPAISSMALADVSEPDTTACRQPTSTRSPTSVPSERSACSSFPMPDIDRDALARIDQCLGRISSSRNGRFQRQLAQIMPTVHGMALLPVYRRAVLDSPLAPTPPRVNRYPAPLRRNDAATASPSVQTNSDHHRARAMNGISRSSAPRDEDHARRYPDPDRSR